jgi:hypothetical protein
VCRPPLRRSIWHAAFALCLVCVPASAAAAGDDWSDLDTATRALLEPWRANWAQFSAGDRQRLLANARRWQSMSASERAQMLVRQVAWGALPQSQRADRRQRFAAWNALTPEDQARVRIAATHFDALPVLEQQRRRAMFAALDADSQHGWLLGPTSGGWIASVSSLFAYLPAGERTATLAMLQTLPVDAHAPLLELARRLPEAQRESLRRELLSTAAPARLQLLLRRLEQ